TGNPQHPQGVFGKSRRYMPQQAVSDVLLASIGVDDFALVVHGHGVDGQVAALQVLFQRNLGGGMESETAVAATALAFGSGEGVFLSGLRVKEYREVLADRAEAEVQQLLWGGADHYPVTLVPGHAKQLVAHGAADQVGMEVCFHRASLGGEVGLSQDGWVGRARGARRSPRGRGSHREWTGARQVTREVHIG